MARNAPLMHMVRLLSDPPDYAVLDDAEAWTAVRADARRHGLAQLVAFAARGRVPPEEREWCDRVLTRAWTRHSANLGHLERTLDILDAAGIRALVLKGPCLALRHYAPPFLRKPSGDLDVAVARTDVSRACAAMLSAGYSHLGDPEDALAFSHHAVLMHPTLPRVEVHFRSSHGPRGLAMDEFLSRAVPYSLPSGRRVSILAPDDELLYLALHVSTGRLVPFFHLYELHRICASAPREHLIRAARRAEKEHFIGVFWLIDAVFRLYWNEPFLPPELRWRRPWLHRLVDNAKLYRAYEEWSDLGGEHTLRSRLRGRWLDLQTCDRPSDTLRCLGLLARYAGRQLLSNGWRKLPVGGTVPVSDSPSATPSQRSF